MPTPLLNCQPTEPPPELSDWSMGRGCPRNPDWKDSGGEEFNLGLGWIEGGSRSQRSKAVEGQSNVIFQKATDHMPLGGQDRAATKQASQKEEGIETAIEWASRSFHSLLPLARIWPWDNCIEDNSKLGPPRAEHRLFDHYQFDHSLWGDWMVH